MDKNTGSVAVIDNAYIIWFWREEAIRIEWQQYVNRNTV